MAFRDESTTVDECREIFMLYDRVGDNKIDQTQICDVLRALETNPTESDIKKIKKNLDCNRAGKERVSFEQFYPVYQNLRDRQKKDGANPEYFIECLRVFDRNCNGLINAAEFRHVLTTLGDKLTDEEVDQLLTGFEDNQGQVYYEDFVKNVMSG